MRLDRVFCDNATVLSFTDIAFVGIAPEIGLIQTELGQFYPADDLVQGRLLLGCLRRSKKIIW